MNPNQDPTFEFVNNLVVSITGYNIDDLTDQTRSETVQKCMDIFTEFVLKYVEAKYGQKDVIRLKISQKQNNNQIFASFAGLEDRLKEALDFFVAQRMEVASQII